MEAKQLIELNDGGMYVTVRLSEVIAYKHEAACLTIHLRGGVSFVLSDEDCVESCKLDSALGVK